MTKNKTSAIIAYNITALDNTKETPTMDVMLMQLTAHDCCGGRESWTIIGICCIGTGSAVGMAAACVGVG